MAGGTFDKSVGKVRPGTYINFQSSKQDTISGSDRGIVILPLANHNYGPALELMTISAAAPDEHRAKLGYSITDDDTAGNMLLIREALKGASTVIVAICAEGSAAAQGTGGGLKGVAKYKGTRGNDLSFSVVANPVAGFDVSVFLGGSVVETFTGITAAAGLSGKSEYITFTAQGESGMSAVASVALTGGANNSTTNAGVADFLALAESAAWNTMAFPFTDASLQALAKAKIRYLYEDAGKTVQAVCPSFNADYERIINVTNGYTLEDHTLTAAQATAFVAGITAGADGTESNTYKVVPGAIAVNGAKTHEQAVAAINNGEFFFSVSDAGTVIVEVDINSLVTISATRDKSYRKNKIIRIFDSVAEAIKANFPPNRFENNEDGWNVMEGIGKAILKQLGPRNEGGSGAIMNIDYDTDFVVDREMSSGDSTYFSVGIQPVDTAEKLYFTVTTR